MHILWLFHSDILLRVNSALSGGMTIPQANTGYEPNSRIDMADYSTHDDEDANSHMSDIPLQPHASANVSSGTSALVTFSQAEGDFMPVSIRYRVGPVYILGSNSTPVQTLEVHQQFLDPKKVFNV